jgi:hypothetical protein
LIRTVLNNDQWERIAPDLTCQWTSTLHADAPHAVALLLAVGSLVAIP